MARRSRKNPTVFRPFPGYWKKRAKALEQLLLSQLKCEWGLPDPTEPCAYWTAVVAKKPLPKLVRAIERGKVKAGWFRRSEWVCETCFSRHTERYKLHSDPIGDAGREKK